jgi:hypothetical protein
MASIHIKDFELNFGTQNEKDYNSKPFLLYSPDSVAFLKVYLMPFGQFEKLIMHKTNCVVF